jgi:hypothetical protein
VTEVYQPSRHGRISATIALDSGPINVWVEDDGHIYTERTITLKEFEQIQVALKKADPFPVIQKQ